MRTAALLLALLALSLAAPALAATERPDLEAKLPVAHPVYCADSDAEWMSLGEPFAVAFTWMAGPLAHSIWLSPETCRDLAVTDRKPFADAAETLYHEWFHAELTTQDEGETECLALYVYRYVLQRYWGFTPAEAQKAYKRAWTAHVLLGLFAPQYRGECTFQRRDPVAP